MRLVGDRPRRRSQRPAARAGGVLRHPPGRRGTLPYRILGLRGRVMRYVVAGVVGWMLALAGAGPALAADITVLSTRPELVSGGDALVQVAPAGTPVSVNGRDVSSDFAVRGDGRYTGL